MDPCDRVRSTCAWAAETCGAHVHIKTHALEALSQSLAERVNDAPPAWDDGGWHFCADVGVGGPLTAQYVLVLDALNFCFWPSSTGMEYDTLAISLKRVLESDPNAFSAAALQAASADTIRMWFNAGSETTAVVDVPNADERARRLNEVGEVLAARYGGLAANLVAAARGSAVELVRLVVAEFPGFRDEAVVEGRHVYFYKRAQIFVGDIWAAYGRKTDDSSPYAFRDISRLTCFADYRIPQLLRALDVFEYSTALAERIDRHEVIAPYSHEEIGIRACTVVAVDRICAAVNARLRTAGVTRPAITPVEVDWLLWQRGEAEKDAIKPHHRTLTIFY